MNPNRLQNWASFAAATLSILVFLALSTYADHRAGTKLPPPQAEASHVSVVPFREAWAYVDAHDASRTVLELFEAE